MEQRFGVEAALGSLLATAARLATLLAAGEHLVDAAAPLHADQVGSVCWYDLIRTFTDQSARFSEALGAVLLLESIGVERVLVY